MKSGFSSNIAKFMTSSCKDSTLKQYETFLRRWLIFCQINEIYDPCKCNIHNVIEFIYELYIQGVSYSGCNTARSALSLILNPLDSISIGAHPLVIRMLKAISNARPSIPRYDTVWDASLVLNMFKQWNNNENLNLKDLSLKLISLMALTTAQRVQTFASIKICNITGVKCKEIVIPAKLKTYKAGKYQPTLILKPYVNTKLCVLKCLNEYLSRTSTLRGTEDSLFISIKPPHVGVTSQTLSRWLKSVLELANVDTNIYKAHSFRHVSTSKAMNNNVNLDVIFSRAGWSKGSLTFARFYNRPVDDRYKFADAVLSS